MCGQYLIAEEDAPDALDQAISTLNRRGVSVKRGEILPTDTAPVFANSRSGHVSPFAMRWGYTLPDGRALINARSETAARKALFADGMRFRRCLVPASLYYEWDAAKRRYAFSRGDLLWMAGIYRPEAGGAAFTILTREAPEGIAAIHTRMPVLLPDGMRGDWLDWRYKADELIRAALTDVSWVKVPGAAEQISFEEFL